ncbi:MAG: phosphatidylserine decarboxylase [Aquificaceae bacterium]|nr:MAG: phosphatidylserine decarboxylase [Aquificaceae bacterium]
MQASFTDYLKSWPLYALPHHAISRIIFKLTRIESSLVPSAITKFSKAFDVDLSQAVNPDPNSYKTFNEFFTRPIKPALRPIADTELVSPVDGCISQVGAIKDGSIFQAKGHNYTAQALLGGDAEQAKKYADGQFTTIYLSPKDYHRIHMPCAGTLKQQIHVPGRLFSVAPHTARTVPNLFARNERVVALFDTEYGEMAMILVGAINVAAIETVWDGLVTPPQGKKLSRKNYADQKITLKKGKEMGRFNMGSTVILLFTKDAPKFSEKMIAELPLMMGQAIS